jgi:uncharacterized protein (TIGR02757 family)
MELSTDALRDFLNEKSQQYNHPDFIAFDPILIPKQFDTKEDIEIAGFLSAIIAWGTRASIIKSASNIMGILGNQPHDYILNSTAADWEAIDHFVHRTFNIIDLRYCLQALQHLYKHHGGLHDALRPKANEAFMDDAIERFRSLFFEINHPKRTTKHIANPAKGSAAKRIHMFLRWMVRQDNNGVDFGLWNDIPTSKLSCPLDVHTGNIARKLGLLKRKQNDQKSVRELDEQLRILDPKDPVKYDFALFGLGVFEKF